MISVIIPTYKEPDALDVCLNSLFKGQVSQNEIIVVVDGFYDLNKPILDKYPEVKIINFPELLFKKKKKKMTFFVLPVGCSLC